MKPEMDYSLYLVTDRALAGERDFEDLVGRAIRGDVRLYSFGKKKPLPENSMSGRCG